MLSYWENIYKYLYNPLESVYQSTTNFWPSTSQDIHNSEPRRSEDEIVHPQLKGNVPSFEDFYVGHIGDNPRDEFISRVDVVEGQMVIVS